MFWQFVRLKNQTIDASKSTDRSTERSRTISPVPFAPIRPMEVVTGKRVHISNAIAPREVMAEHPRNLRSRYGFPSCRLAQCND